MPNNSPPPEPTQPNRRQTIYRPQAVPVVLSDDPVSKERREAALRARGLLPSRQPRDLSAIEAEADRRVDALRKFDSPSPPGSDNSHSDANEIAQTWRIRNSQWLSCASPNSDSPVDPMTQGPYSFVHSMSTPVFTDSLYSDASPFDTPSHPEGSSEPPTLGPDTPASIVLDGPSSISKTPFPGSLAHSLKACSYRGSIGHRNLPLSRAASLSSISSSNLEDLATEKPTRETSEDLTTGSAQLTRDSPVPSTTSRAEGSLVAEIPELSVPSQRPHDQLPFEPHNTTVRANLSIPASSPLYLHTTTSDTFLASPTTPTLSASMCYSSETDPGDGLATNENGEHDVSPVSRKVKEEEGGFLCQETILEGSESLSDDDDIDQFFTPPNTALPAVDTHSATDDRAATSRRTALLSRLKTRGSTLLPPRPSSLLSTSTSMVNLRKVSGTLFGRTRRLSMVSDLDAAPRSPPPPRLAIKIYDGPGLSAEASGIDDDEARRLCELAFLT